MAIRYDKGLKGLLAVCAGALVIHLIPLFLPRDMPGQDLAIARAMAAGANRAKVLKPLKDNPKATGADLREAAELLRESAPLDAYELVKEADRREPGSVDTQLLLARVCHGQRMSRCEEESLRKVEQHAPADPRPALMRADFQEADGDEEAALGWVEKAYARAPGVSGVGVRYARLLSRQGRGDEAITVLEQQGPHLGRAQLMLEQGRVRIAQGRVEEGRRLFSQAVAAEPKLAVANYELGLAAFRLGDFLGAEDALREAARLDITDMKPLAALCELHRKTKRTDELTATRMDLERRFPDRMDEVREACQTP